MEKLDILFVSTPLLDLSYPPAGPAVLQAVVKSYGKTCNFFDSNVYLYNDVCGRDDLLFEKIGNKFSTPVINTIPENPENLDIVDLFFDEDDFDGKYFIRRWLTEIVGKILDYNADWIGISVFSYFSQRTSFLLAYQLKKLCPDIKIVIGGKGATIAMFGPDGQAFNQRLKHLFTDEQRDSIGMNFYDVMLGLGLANLAVRGEGENSVMEIWNPDLPKKLADKPINFIRGRVEDLVMEDVPFVDYDNYNLDQYRYVNDEKVLAVTGSKGCVRKCTFCDIGVIWPKFKHRTGKHIAAEMIHLYKRYNVKKFFLTDSLVNGSQSAFTEFVEELSKAKTEEGISDLKWHGQYITRPIDQVKQSIYQNMAISGAEGLTIGVETGSDQVREHMRKKFSNADLYHELEQFSLNKISTVLLFFSSYPTETQEDFLETLKMWMNLQRFAADRTIYKMTLGQPYTHHYETPLALMQDEIGLQIDPSSDILWILDSNKELDFIERLVRRVISQEVAVALNLPLARNTPELIQLSHTLKSQRAAIENFFDLSAKNIPLYQNKYNLPNLPQAIMTPPEVQKMVYDYLTTVNISFDLEIVSDDTAWQPQVTISVKDQIETITLSTSSISKNVLFSLPLGDTASFSIMFNSQPAKAHMYKINDVDYESTKCLKITKFKINNVDLLSSGKFFKAHSKFTPFTNNKEYLSHTSATIMFTNGIFSIDLVSPIINDIIQSGMYGMNQDDIKNDEESLRELKYELIQYNRADKEKWIQILEQSK